MTPSMMLTMNEKQHKKKTPNKQTSRTSLGIEQFFASKIKTSSHSTHTKHVKFLPHTYNACQTLHSLLPFQSLDVFRLPVLNKTHSRAHQPIPYLTFVAFLVHRNDNNSTPHLRRDSMAITAIERSSPPQHISILQQFVCCLAHVFCVFVVSEPARSRIEIISLHSSFCLFQFICPEMMGFDEFSISYAIN